MLNETLVPFVFFLQLRFIQLMQQEDTTRRISAC